MKGIVKLCFVALVVAGCAASGTQVMAPYQLADGSRFQDVITIGADKSGSASVVTHVKTFRVSGRSSGTLVTEATGTSPGLRTVATGAAVAGITSGLTAGAIVAVTRRGHHRGGSGGGDDGPVDPMDCSSPANQDTQYCICQNNPRLPGCESDL